MKVLGGSLAGANRHPRLELQPVSMPCLRELDGHVIDILKHLFLPQFTILQRITTIYAQPKVLEEISYHRNVLIRERYHPWYLVP